MKTPYPENTRLPKCPDCGKRVGYAYKSSGRIRRHKRMMLETLATKEWCSGSNWLYDGISEFEYAPVADRTTT